MANTRFKKKGGGSGLGEGEGVDLGEGGGRFGVTHLTPSDNEKRSGMAPAMLTDHFLI